MPAVFTAPTGWVETAWQTQPSIGGIAGETMAVCDAACNPFCRDPRRNCHIDAGIAKAGRNDRFGNAAPGDLVANCGRICWPRLCGTMSAYCVMPMTAWRRARRVPRKTTQGGCRQTGIGRCSGKEFNLTWHDWLNMDSLILTMSAGDSRSCDFAREDSREAHISGKIFPRRAISRHLRNTLSTQA